MIISKLSGGLGNQMFQYASARSLSEGNSIHFDFSFLSTHIISDEIFTARAYELHIFKNLKIKKQNKILLKLVFTRNSKYNLFKHLLPSRLKKIIFLNDTNYTSCDNFDGAFYLDGYFQNPNYFQNIRNELVKEFQFPPLPHNLLLFLKEISYGNSVSVHIRRADYLKSNNKAIHGIIPLKYYNDAISMITKKVKAPVFYIFSDDMSWCRQNIINSNVDIRFVDNQKEPSWTDMYLMSRCKHQIIANSTFSWWGAWLNDYDKKIVIAPKKWFIDKKTDIIPEEWISI